jgi:hypothetical protein
MQCPYSTTRYEVPTFPSWLGGIFEAFQTFNVLCKQRKIGEISGSQGGEYKMPVF